MPSTKVFKPTPIQLKILQAENLADPYYWKVPSGLKAEDIVQGELVTLATQQNQGRLVLAKFTFAAEDNQNLVFGMRIDNTSHDKVWGGALPVLQGLYIFETTNYEAGQGYAVNDLVAARFVPETDGGGWGPVGTYTDSDSNSHNAATHANGVVLKPPTGSGDFMRIMAYPSPIERNI